MPLDRAILGNMASGQMEALERDYGDEDGVEIGTVMTLVEIIKPEGLDEHGNMRYSSLIRRRHNAPDPFRLVGILDQSIHEILAGPGIGS
jgi:hypothetical protein